MNNKHSKSVSNTCRNLALSVESQCFICYQRLILIFMLFSVPWWPQLIMFLLPLSTFILDSLQTTQCGDRVKDLVHQTRTPKTFQYVDLERTNFHAYSWTNCYKNNHEIIDKKYSSGRVYKFYI